MKLISKQSLVILFSLFLIQSCFPDFNNDKFKSFPLYLYNNSSRTGCIQDSVDVTFVIQNVSKSNSKEVRIDVAARDQKNAVIEGTKDEFINVKLLRSADSTLIFEQKIAIGKNIHIGGDLAVRQLAYCNNETFVLTGFDQ
jgi:hypothetical protein